MITLIDNTALHRVFTVLNPHQSSAPIRKIDVMALFHFAEHILFSTRIEVSGFEIPEIKSTSVEAIDFLSSRGYIASSVGNTFLTMTEFSDKAYARACEDAAWRVIEDINAADLKTLRKCGKLVDSAARPTGVKRMPTLKWFTRGARNDRVRLKEEALSQKALGSFDYAISANDALFEQVQILASRVKIRRHEIASALSIFFRAAVNQSLASQRTAYYSPAPQRARIIERTDQLFRHDLEKRIAQLISSVDGNSMSNMMKMINHDERLPIPMFAIHFLRKTKPRNVNEVLEKARTLRDAPDVTKLRQWMTKSEEKFGSINPEKRKAAINELQGIAEDVGLMLGGNKLPLYSILRGSISLSNTSDLIFKPEFSGVAEYTESFLKRHFGRRAFLALLATEFAFDTHVGVDMLKMVGRPIID